jgi:hypothetical protein
MTHIQLHFCNLLHTAQMQLEWFANMDFFNKHINSPFFPVSLAISALSFLKIVVCMCESTGEYYEWLEGNHESEKFV